MGENMPEKPRDAGLWIMLLFIIVGVLYFAWLAEQRAVEKSEPSPASTQSQRDKSPY